MKHQVLPLLLILCAYSAQTLRFSVFFHFEVSKHMEFVVGGGKVKYPADVFFFFCILGWSRHQQKQQLQSVNLSVCLPLCLIELNPLYSAHIIMFARSSPAAAQPLYSLLKYLESS